VKGGSRSKNSKKPYGPWLRVPTPRQRREFSNTLFFEQKGEGKEADQKHQTRTYGHSFGDNRIPSDSGCSDPNN
jgi:hypothetical protein